MTSARRIYLRSTIGEIFRLRAQDDLLDDGSMSVEQQCSIQTLVLIDSKEP